MLRRVFKQKLNNTMRLSYSLRDKNISEESRTGKQTDFALQVVEAQRDDSHGWKEKQLQEASEAMNRSVAG